MNSSVCTCVFGALSTSSSTIVYYSVDWSMHDNSHVIVVLCIEGLQRVVQH